MTKSISSPEYRLFCELLIEARKQQGLTQADVAARLGIHQTLVSKYERGERRLDPVEYLRTSDALEVDPHSLLRAVHAVASWRQPGESEQENALWADMDAITLLESLKYSREQVSSLIKSYRAKSHKVVPVKSLHIIISRQVDREKGKASW